MLDERYLWLSAFIEHPKFNLDTRTATNSHLIEVYNNIQKVFSVCKSFYHPTAKPWAFRSVYSVVGGSTPAPGSRFLLYFRHEAIRFYQTT